MTEMKEGFGREDMQKVVSFELCSAFFFLPVIIITCKSAIKVLVWVNQTG